jgi:hypothetical protein
MSEHVSAQFYSAGTVPARILMGYIIAPIPQLKHDPKTHLILKSEQLVERPTVLHLHSQFGKLHLHMTSALLFLLGQDAQFQFLYCLPKPTAVPRVHILWAILLLDTHHLDPSAWYPSSLKTLSQS